MALLAFIDDGSWQWTSPKGVLKHFVAYGAVVLPEATLPELEADFNALKKNYGFPKRGTAEAEVKFSPERKHWMHGNLVSPARDRFFGSVGDLFVAAQGTALLSIYDCSVDSSTPAVGKRRALENLFERLPSVVAAAGVGICITVCDSTGGSKETRRLIEQVTGISINGTWYRDDLGRFAYPIALTAESHLHAGLQIADLVTGAAKGMIGGGNAVAAGLWSKLLPRFYRNGSTVRGWGIKVRSGQLSSIYTKLKV